MAIVKLTVIKVNKKAVNHRAQGFVCDKMGKMHVDGTSTQFEYLDGNVIPVIYNVNQTEAQIQQLCCCVGASQVGSGV